MDAIRKRRSNLEQLTKQWMADCNMVTNPFSDSNILVPSSVVDELAEIQAQEEEAIRILQRARNLQKNTHKGSQDSESENSGYAECHAHDEFDSPQPAENNNEQHGSAARPLKQSKRIRQSRVLEVFDMAQVANAKKLGASASKEWKVRIEAGCKEAERNNGLRILPDFKRVRYDLDKVSKKFSNFNEVINHYVEELTLVGASRPDSFRIAPVLLDGAPGVGKTAFAQALAEKLGVPFKKFAAGGMQTSAILTGTSTFWGNSQTGEIFNLLARTDYATAVILIDEADKLISGSYYPILPALLDLLEPETARNYKDESLSLSFDASRLMVLMTSNKKENMDPALLSRCRVFQVDAPGLEQRKFIARSVFLGIKNGLDGNKRVTLDMDATNKLAGEDIDIRLLIMQVRKAFAKALHFNERMVVPQMLCNLEATNGDYQSCKIGFRGKE